MLYILRTEAEVLPRLSSAHVHMDARGFFIGARGMCWLLGTSAGSSGTQAQCNCNISLTLHPSNHQIRQDVDTVHCEGSSRRRRQGDCEGEEQDKVAPIKGSRGVVVKDCGSMLGSDNKDETKGGDESIKDVKGAHEYLTGENDETAPRRGATDAETGDRSMEVRRTWASGMVPSKGTRRDEERDRLRARRAAAAAAVEDGWGRASRLPSRPHLWLSDMVRTDIC
ncbi:hypothetical protein BHM03_00007496 [Ensete ventricosum]|nr:hypothetical protein BHM03_00007496 [Ensete ventricosum]